MFTFLKKFFKGNTTSKESIPEPDYDALINKIKDKESVSKIEPGRRIYAFEYGLLEIRFDRDITLNGRICVFSGEERLFTFTVFAKQREYDILRNAFISVITFLNSERGIQNLPDNNILKGYINH